MVEWQDAGAVHDERGARSLIGFVEGVLRAVTSASGPHPTAAGLEAGHSSFQAHGSLKVAYLLLAAAQAVGLLLIPFSGLGLWLQLLALGIFAWRTGFQPVGVIPLAVLFGIGVTAELVRLAMGASRIPGPTRKRLGISGVAGGFAGAAVGVAVPLLGSMFGALIGSTVATLIGTGTMRSSADSSSPVAASALAMALSTATGVAVAVFTLLIALR